MSRRSVIVIPVHLVWATRERRKTITEEIEQDVFELLRSTVSSLGAIPVAVGGYRDHVHVAAVFTDSLALGDFMGVLKGHSSGIIRAQMDPKFQWQRGFGAFGFGVRSMASVRSYINEQKSRHEQNRTVEAYERPHLYFESLEPEDFINSFR